MQISTVLAPKSVAIVGASTDPGKTSGRPIRFLKQHGFKGDIWPVNPVRDAVQGLKAFPNLEALPAVPDQVFVVLDTLSAMEAVSEAIELGVPFVVVLASGFSEAGAEGLERENHLRAMAKGSDTRILGPNSLGFVRPETGLVLTANAAFAVDDLPSGNISVISQSGSAIGTFLSRGRVQGIGFANLVSVGNEADLSVGEIGRMLIEDEATDTFILFLESLKHTDKLEEFAAAAAEANKKVLVYKLGRSSVGAELAVSHTGALVSSDDVADTFIQDLGFHRLDVFEATFEGAALFSRRWQTPSNGARVAVVSTTGGGGALVADRLGLSGVQVIGASDRVRQKIATTGIDVGHGLLIDLTLAGTKPEVMRGAIDALLDDDSCDAVIAVIGSSAEYFPELAVQPLIAAVAERGSSIKPLAVFTVPHAEQALKLLAQANIAAFRTPEACADAMVTRLREPRLKLGRAASFQPIPISVNELKALPRQLSEGEAMDLFAHFDLPVVRRTFIAKAALGDSHPQANALNYPLVAKIASRDLPHKSEYGGVKLNLQDWAEVSAAMEQIMDSVQRLAPEAETDGILLQEQLTGVQEVIVGLRRDAVVGPLITLGVGGIYAELYADASTRRAPVTSDEVMQMISEVKGLKMLSGYRGKAKGDIQALAQAVAAFSQLGACEQIVEAEVNPLVVRAEGKGVAAVDGLAILAEGY